MDLNISNMQVCFLPYSSDVLQALPLCIGIWEARDETLLVNSKAKKASSPSTISVRSASMFLVPWNSRAIILWAFLSQLLLKKPFICFVDVNVRWTLAFPNSVSACSGSVSIHSEKPILASTFHVLPFHIRAQGALVHPHCFFCLTCYALEWTCPCSGEVVLEDVPGFLGSFALSEQPLMRSCQADPWRSWNPFSCSPEFWFLLCTSFRILNSTI